MKDLMLGLTVLITIGLMIFCNVALIVGHDIR